MDTSSQSAFPIIRRKLPADVTVVGLGGAATRSLSRLAVLELSLKCQVAVKWKCHVIEVAACHTKNL